jgi:hypothetical protein
MGYGTVYSGKLLLMFYKTMLPPPSEQLLFLDYYKTAAANTSKKSVTYSPIHMASHPRRLACISINTAVRTSNLTSNDLSRYFTVEENRLHKGDIPVTHAV